MFLAHFAGDIKSVLKMHAADIYYWYIEAVKLHNKLNSSEDN